MRIWSFLSLFESIQFMKSSKRQEANAKMFEKNTMKSTSSFQSVSLQMLNTSFLCLSRNSLREIYKTKKFLVNVQTVHLKPYVNIDSSVVEWSWHDDSDSYDNIFWKVRCSLVQQKVTKLLVRGRNILFNENTNRKTEEVLKATKICYKSNLERFLTILLAS